MAQGSLYFFAKAVLGFDKLTLSLHKEVCDFLTLPDRRKMLVLPRGHYKTTISTISFPMWLSVNNPNIRILLSSSTTTNAQKMLGLIRAKWERCDMLRWLFPELVPNTGLSRWNDSCAVINRTQDFPEGTYEAIGAGGTAVSRHYDCIIEDDLVSEDHLISKEQMDKVISWHQYKESLFVSPGKGLDVLIGTRWAHYDLLSHVMETEVDRVRYIRAATENGVPIFPEEFTLQELERLLTVMGPYRYSCFTGDTLVRTSVGDTPIDEINVGDLVLTHDGTYHPVEHVHSETADETYKLRFWGDHVPIKCTGNHPFFCGGVLREAKDIVPNFDKVDCPNPSQYADIPYTEDDMWLVGRYLAEGWLPKGNKEIIWCAGKHEGDLLERTKALVGVPTNSVNQRGGGDIRYSSLSTITYAVTDERLRALCEQFGQKAHGKFLPEWATRLPRNLADSLLGGYLSGDGYIDQSSQVNANSVSLPLLRGFQQLLSFHKVQAAVSKVSDGGPTTIENRVVTAKPLYNLRIYKSTRKTKFHYNFAKLRSIEKVAGSIQVYNLQVAQNHSFVVGRYAVSNCQYLNDPTQDTARKFEEQWLQYFDLLPAGNYAYYTAVDPAASVFKAGGGVARDSDYTSLVTIAVNPEGDIFVVDVVCERLGVDEFIYELFRVVESYNPQQVGIETNAFQRALLFPIRAEMKRTNNHFPIVELKATRAATKQLRILALQPYFANKTIHVRKDDKELLHEFRLFPLAKHDDVLDALAYVVQMHHPAQNTVFIPKGHGDPLSFDTIELELTKHRTRALLSPWQYVNKWEAALTP